MAGRGRHPVARPPPARPDPMCPQERSSLISIATNLLVNAYVVWRLWPLYTDGALSGPDGPMVWANVVIWTIPASIALVILAHIAVAIATRHEAGPAVDERDRLFQVRGMYVSVGACAVGMIGGLVVLANGWAPLVGFLVIYYAATLGDLIGNGVRIASYRLGS